ncbi:non-ribosomal peptide synthetase [Streptomyces alkaliterrae]|uniref:Amino acid adenylation domain-containing protein n=1 Tax=Streptomyces alkaliterrae TaxID=2213162 RepID=A0A5P0YM94_9ACTN|nr:non-ribosomal peptide synthetase [Streptomyces alkaliterrae]MBB1259199.1 amino acid adenylation domain-containing protein [Streptomyces alkaliterrae]MQS00777.1 amino acid adenylation domain-containing protein [Streptomyces alkaliterrae]
MNRTNDIEAIYPLSPLQHAMLITSQLAPNSGVYVVQLSFDVCGPLDLNAFRAAWDEVTARHAVHRTLFMRLDQSRPLQVVRRRVDLPWREEDWTSLRADEQRGRFDARMEDDRGHDFDLSRAPLMRCLLVRLSEDRHRFLWTRHHAISDGWSMPIVVTEVMQHYRARVSGGTAPLAPAVQYREYIAWLRGQDLAEAEKYWRRSLAGVHGPTSLGVDRPSAGRPGPGRIAKRSVTLSREATAALQDGARRERITLSTLVQGAWALLLRRYGGERDVLLGMVASGRPPSVNGVESMVGCFLNTLPVRVHVDDEAPVADWLRGLQAAQAEREEYGYAPPAEIRRWAGVQGDVPLFDSLVVFENFPIRKALDLSGGGIRVESIRTSEQTSFPLTLTVVPGERMSLKIAFDEARFEGAAVERMLEHYQVLLSGLVAAPSMLGELPVMTGEEARRLLVDWNRTRAGHHEQRPVHELFEAQAAATPDATAVIAGEVRLTYAELDAHANRLARRLRAAGVTSGAFVGVCLDRGAYLPAALLAVLKAGAAYVPLDPAYPPSRIDRILSDASPVVVLAQASTRPALSRSSAPLLAVDEEGGANEAAGSDALADDAAVHEQSVALVIYTSGSTGRPKGVRITHRNVVSLLMWAKEVFSADELEGTLASTSICFDLSVFELFLPLTTGATVILADNALLLPSLPARDRVTLVNTVPSAMDTLLRLGGLPEGVRVVNLAGEPLPRGLVDQLHARDGVRKVYNLYGPSEDTVYSTFTLVPEDGAKPLIGRPIANAQSYVLDSAMRPVPTGIAGELYLGGDGVSQGYHRRPSLTAERYVPDPFGGRPGARLFRTGDLARWLPCGELEYLGRNDRQIKLRGFRIELGEIEAVLREITGVRDAVTAVREDQLGTRRLVAYVVMEEGHGFDRGDAVAAVRAALPEYMTPAAFVELPAIPLTPNGKADWTALPSPEPERAQRAYRKPENEIEKTIAAAWSEVLGVSRPGADDGFFDIGGNSILLARVFGHLKVVYPERLNMIDLYRYPTIASLARHISGTESEQAFAGVRGRLERRRAAMGERNGGNR